MNKTPPNGNRQCKCNNAEKKKFYIKKLHNYFLISTTPVTSPVR